jgi:hypothetical protein
MVWNIQSRKLQAMVYFASYLQRYTSRSLYCAININSPPTVLQVMVSQFVLGVRYGRLISATGGSLLS